MKIETLEATPSCRAITVEFLDLTDLQGLMVEHGEKILDLVHSQILAHNFRGQHRATDKQGKLLKAEDHIYKMSDFIKGMTAGARSGEPSKEDVAMAGRLSSALAGRYEQGDTVEDALTAMVAFHASLCPGWEFAFPADTRFDEGAGAPEVTELAQYARAYRLYKAAREKATTFK